MINAITLISGENIIHFYIDEDYLGLLHFEDGDLSDFRSIMRKRKLKCDGELYSLLRLSLFELLNSYLYEKRFLEGHELQKLKRDIVSGAETTLKSFKHEENFGK